MEIKRTLGNIGEFFESPSIYEYRKKLEESWGSFGGESGGDVNLVQLFYMVSLVSRLGKLESRFFPINRDSLVVRKIRLQEAKGMWTRYDDMAHLGTQKGRLEAAVFFSRERQNILANLEQPAERERRATACTAAINLLMLPEPPDSITMPYSEFIKGTSIRK